MSSRVAFVGAGADPTPSTSNNPLAAMVESGAVNPSEQLAQFVGAVGQRLR